MKKPTSVSLDPKRWKQFVGKTTDEGRKASPVVQAMIDGYLSGSLSPYHKQAVDWAEQAEHIYRIEELR